MNRLVQTNVNILLETKWVECQILFVPMHESPQSSFGCIWRCAREGVGCHTTISIIISLYQQSEVLIWRRRVNKFLRHSISHTFVIARVIAISDIETKGRQIVNLDSLRPKLINNIHNFHEILANRIWVINEGSVILIVDPDRPKS